MLKTLKNHKKSETALAIPLNAADLAYAAEILRIDADEDDTTTRSLARVSAYLQKESERKTKEERALATSNHLNIVPLIAVPRESILEFTIDDLCSYLNYRLKNAGIEVEEYDFQINVDPKKFPGSMKDLNIHRIETSAVAGSNEGIHIQIQLIRPSKHGDSILALSAKCYTPDNARLIISTVNHLIITF